MKAENRTKEKFRRDRSDSIAPLINRAKLGSTSHAKARVHIDRAARGYRDHCNSGCAVVAGVEPGEGGRTDDGLPE